MENVLPIGDGMEISGIKYLKRSMIIYKHLEPAPPAIFPVRIQAGFCLPLNPWRGSPSSSLPRARLCPLPPPKHLPNGKTIPGAPSFAHIVAHNSSLSPPRPVYTHRDLSWGHSNRKNTTLIIALIIAGACRMHSPRRMT